MSEELEFTGERFTPECVREIWYEHLHRYALAERLVAGKRVLDAACGEGYGSALLARSAASVTGVDVSEDAVAHARGRYGDTANLSFEVADCTRLPFAEQSFDVIVSFETLEHLEAHDDMLAGFRRLLAPGGVLLLSSPDKAVYTDQQGNDNPWHVRELYRDELEALLRRHFPAWRLLGQRLQFQSVIWDMAASGPTLFQRWDGERVDTLDSVGREPVYYLAVAAAADADLPDLGAGLWLFDDAEESVYDHYIGEIRRNMAAGGIIADRDAEIERLRAEIESLRSAPAPETAASTTPAPLPWYRRLFGAPRRQG
ncbi:class I SAM-dependent methyltransferase [Marinihelvus fidelis]|uniref:class I SAM-dependent methyltransferase n=1 Tax=Marinihelvus fidelis TaxID=2613842 RepID=UPI00178572FA|nr:class I SAM-dependent methyltransferase [Marinihelvus fidelis]